MAGDNITVHVEWLARRLAQQQEDAVATEQHRIMLKTLRVSRVPEHVRDHNADAYTPGLVAIGPIHAANRRLRAGTRLKMSYLNSLISRGHRDPASHLAVIQSYVRLVAAREGEARAMYTAEDVGDISAEEFIEMLVLDGCFIIEHLLNVTTGKEEASLHATPFGPVQLSVDLVLAENQIPFFVLVDLIKSTKLPEFDRREYQPTELLMKLVLYYLAGEEGRDMSDGLPLVKDVCHILHLLHAMVTAARTRSEPPLRLQVQDAVALETMQESARLQGRLPLRLLVPLLYLQEAARLLGRLPLLLLVPLLYPFLPVESRWSARYGRVVVPSATDLMGMWVRFKKARGGSTGKAPTGIASVLGPVAKAVKLAHYDWLRLPQLRIELRTVPMLLNLMAFEQLTDYRAGDVSAYVWLMAKLVQSPQDVGVLVAAEVVQSSTSVCESNEDVLRLLRKVGAAAMASKVAGVVEMSYLADTLQKLRKRTSNQLLMMKADVQRYYINVPWRLVAVFVTVVTTVANVLQTFASFVQKS